MKIITKPLEPKTGGVSKTNKNNIYAGGMKIANRPTSTSSNLNEYLWQTLFIHAEDNDTTIYPQLWATVLYYGEDSSTSGDANDYNFIQGLCQNLRLAAPLMMAYRYQTCMFDKMTNLN